MKIIVLEGAELSETAGRQVMRGWRNYMILRNKSWPEFSSNTFISQPGRARKTAENLSAKFYEAGTWESKDSPAVAGAFPCPRLSVLDEFLADGKERVA